MAYPELTDKQRNYPYSGNVQNPLVVPETRGTVLPTGATPEQTAAGKQNWQSNAPQQYANNPVGTVQYNIFKAMEQQKAQPVTQPQGNGTGTAAGSTNSRTSSGNGATETGGTRPIRSMDDLVSAMYTDPQQEEKLRKASVANQRILAVGDALRHIGNIFHTVNYAQSQQFNQPWAEEQARYERGKAIRDAANARYYSYMQAKAAQDARIRQAEAQLQYNMEKDARDYELRKNESDARAKLNEARIQTQNMLTYLDELKAKGQITENERKEIVNKYLPQKEESIIARNNRSNTGRSGGGRGSGMSDYNVKETKTKVTNKDGSVTWISEKERRGQYGSQKSSSTKTTASNKSGFFNR